MSGSEKKAEDSKLSASCWGPMNSYVSPNHWVMMFGCYISSNGIETKIVSSFCGWFWGSTFWKLQWVKIPLNHWDRFRTWKIDAIKSRLSTRDWYWCWQLTVVMFDWYLWWLHWSRFSSSSSSSSSLNCRCIYIYYLSIYKRTRKCISIMNMYIYIYVHISVIYHYHQRSPPAGSCPPTRPCDRPSMARLGKSLENDWWPSSRLRCTHMEIQHGYHGLGKNGGWIFSSVGYLCYFSLRIFQRKSTSSRHQFWAWPLHLEQLLWLVT